MAIKVITAPTAEPISIEEAKSHLRVVGTDDDAYITALIVGARCRAEHLTGRALMPQTLELALDGFGDVIDLPRPPLVSVTSVKYLDESGVLQTMVEVDYLLDSHSEPARLKPAYGATWPATRRQMNAVLIRYQAVYENAEAVPQEVKDWMLIRIATAYEVRESVIVGASVAEVPYVDRLLDAARIWSI